MEKSLNKNTEKSMMLTDNMWKVMWRLSWPAVLAMVLYGLNALIDAAFIGHFVNESAMAGVSIVYPLLQIPLGLGSLIGTGAGAILSMAIGNGNKEMQRKIIPNVNFLNIVFSVSFTIIGLLSVNPLLRLMGAKGTDLAYGQDYFVVCLIGGLFWIAGLSYNMVVRAEGKMKSAAFIMGLGVVVNIISNYIFMAVFNFGVQGAAWGTNIGMFVYVVGFFIYASGKKPTFEVNQWKISRDSKLCKQILSLGFPALLMSIMTVVQGIVIMNVLNRYGNSFDIAFYGVSYRCFTFLLMPISGLMRALQPVMGVNFGAKKYDRVIESYKVFGMAAFIIMMPFWIVSMVSPEFVVGLMMPNQIFLAESLSNFRFLMLVLPVLPIIFMALAMFPSINNPKPAAIIGMTRQFVFYIPVMLILPKYFGLDWIYKGSFLIDFILIIFTSILVKKEFNKLRKGDVKHLEK